MSEQQQHNSNDEDAHRKQRQPPTKLGNQCNDKQTRFNNGYDEKRNMHKPANQIAELFLQKKRETEEHRRETAQKRNERKTEAKQTPKVWMIVDRRWTCLWTFSIEKPFVCRRASYYIYRYIVYTDIYACIHTVVPANNTLQQQQYDRTDRRGPNLLVLYYYYYYYYCLHVGSAVPC